MFPPIKNARYAIKRMASGDRKLFILPKITKPKTTNIDKSLSQKFVPFKLSVSPKKVEKTLKDFVLIAIIIPVKSAINVQIETIKNLILFFLIAVITNSLMSNQLFFVFKMHPFLR